VKKAVWRLSKVVKLKRRPVEDYAKTLAARLGLPAHVVKKALKILESNRRLLTGKNPWVWAAAAVWLAAVSERLSIFIVAEAAGATPGSVVNAATQHREALKA
jgi:transcription initiation factor TFIIIB Brf1 subunit/transcription initiation factor TFIIB